MQDLLPDKAMFASFCIEQYAHAHHIAAPPKRPS